MLLTVVINRNDKILNRNAVNIFRFDTTHFITSTPTDEKSNIMGAYKFFFIFSTSKVKFHSLSHQTVKKYSYILINIFGLMISQ